ncbi:hypothetical protein CFOL_v3_29981 [Cephalotus follicularis]|uniref:Uncharacterized protein n=1 Tax=Cephalotus follicularis TaxID=3775 RepID=A0A1Q3D2B4_CEPFO|nr:hypothetical protein CFOL_v3_29981 [Cephalotus follicularis]
MQVIITKSIFYLLGVPKTGPVFLKPVCRFLKLKHTKVQVKKALTLEIRSSFKTKVFEDLSEGIICYRDDRGDIICEGYDEGPRFHQQVQRTTYNTRDAHEMMNLVQQRQWLLLVSGGDLKNADIGIVPGQEDLHGKWP